MSSFDAICLSVEERRCVPVGPYMAVVLTLLDSELVPPKLSQASNCLAVNDNTMKIYSPYRYRDHFPISFCCSHWFTANDASRINRMKIMAQTKAGGSPLETP